MYTCNIFLLDVLIQLSFREAGQGRAGQGRAGQGSLDDCLETFLALVAGASHQGAWPGVPIQLVHGFNQSNTHHASSPLRMIKTQ